MESWTNWLRPPGPDDPEEALRAAITHWILIATFVSMLALAALLPAVERHAAMMLPMCLTAIATAAVSFVLLHRGRTRAAGAVFCVLAVLLILAGVVLVGDVRSPHLATGVFMVIVTGFLVGTRAGIWVGLGISAGLLGFVVGRNEGLIPAASLIASSYTTWAALTAVLAMTAVLVHVFVGAMQASRLEAADKSRRLEREMQRREVAEASLHRAEKLEALGRLTGGIAHDFNNILTVLLAESALLERSAEAGRALSSAEVAQIGEIRRASELAAALTGQLLSFSRQRVGTPAVINPNESIRSLEPMLKRLINDEIRLDVGPLAATGTVRIDATRFEQVVMNLVLNARDAVSVGGRITVSTADADLDAQWTRRHADSQPGPHVVLEVSDDGVGINPADLGRIFDPFFTTKDHGRGTGLGLASVYGIVKQAGGHVTVDSQVGRATQFSVYLPRTSAASAGAPAKPAAAAPVGERTVMLCQDDAAVRRVTRRTLDDLGYRVLEADSPAAALDLARAHAGPIDVLITDVTMPGTNGRELVEAVRDHRPKIRVLLIAGYPSDALDGKAQERGVAILEKPFSPEQLRDRLEEVLR